MKNFNMELKRYESKDSDSYVTYELKCDVDNKGRIIGYLKRIKLSKKSDKLYIFGFMDNQGKLKMVQFDKDKTAIEYVYNLNLFSKNGYWYNFSEVKENTRRRLETNNSIVNAEVKVIKFSDKSLRKKEKAAVKDILQNNSASILSIFSINLDFWKSVMNDIF